MRKINPIPIGTSRPTPKINIWTSDTVITNNGIRKVIYRKNGRHTDIFGRKLKKYYSNNHKKNKYSNCLQEKKFKYPNRIKLKRFPYYRKIFNKKMYSEGPLSTVN